MLTEQRDIAALASVAWMLLIDTGQWPKWGPSVRAVDAPAQTATADVIGKQWTVRASIAICFACTKGLYES